MVTDNAPISQAGMLASNDFATCYMCQSLPMGGLKDSGFGKFAGLTSRNPTLE